MSDLGRSLSFYTKVLGFAVQAEDVGYAYIVRDQIALRLLESSDTTRTCGQSCYICVENLDGLFEQLQPAIASLPSGRVRPPFDQPYGQREFHVTDEDGLLLFFGEP